MATYRAIAAASATLVGLLRDRFPQDDFGGPLNAAVYQPRDFAEPMKDGIAVCLWRVTANVSRRAQAPRTDLLGRRLKPSLPVDLSYVLVPYAESADRQLRLLGWLLRAVEDLGALVASQLNHFVAENETYSDDETVDLVLDPLSVADQLVLWDRMKVMPPCATYVMRMVQIDSDQVVSEAAPVVMRDIGLGVLQ